MIVAGVLPIVYWRARSHVSYKRFLFGGLVWTAAIVVKTAMDLTLGPPLNAWLLPIYSSLGLVVVWGLILGLRTGFLECGFTYITASRKQSEFRHFDDAVAFGIGFGATEATLLGIGSFLNVLTFVLYPNVLDMLPPNQKAMVANSFSSLGIIPAPIIERFFTLLFHLLGSLLTIYSVQARKAEYFIASFAYKSLLDGLVPWMRSNFNLADAQDVYILECVVVSFGLVGLLGSLWMKNRYHKLSESKPGLTFRTAIIAIALATIILFALTIPLQS